MLHSRKVSGLVRVLLRKTVTPGEHKENIPMHFPPRFAVLLITLTLIRGLPCPQVLAQELDEGYPDGGVVEAIPTVVSPRTLYTWSTTTTGFAWLNASHWTGNPGHYPGVDANSNSIADGASNDVAAFSSMAFTSTIVGINFSASSSSGVSDNTGANGSLKLGAIDYLSTTNKSISIGDNSGTAGTLTFTGAA